MHNMLLGSDLEQMNDAELARVAEATDVFAKLTPDQKTRVVSVLREKGHTVGFLGDGINDAAAMKTADIGISVDTAVDVAKESADIILLEKDLMVLEQGIIEGRKTYANMIKYIKMTASSNFGKDVYKRQTGNMQVWCNGSIFASQANRAGSNPVTCSTRRGPGAISRSGPFPLPKICARVPGDLK